MPTPKRHICQRVTSISWSYATTPLCSSEWTLQNYHFCRSQQTLPLGEALGRERNCRAPSSRKHCLVSCGQLEDTAEPKLPSSTKTMRSRFPETDERTISTEITGRGIKCGPTLVVGSKIGTTQTRLNQAKSDGKQLVSMNNDRKRKN
ncbi:hypothetical protein TGMAS_224675 [Toxoplasma gondii MAS]|uniref:Uncharacterized protein n=1 Tax=Toxoplasma gondii MAS TaxID=943118 RepID=A0A086QMK8_TOXGO|nr:hypothetical protein TGMAS_224675 [Toxoplasma gondii MAS]